MKIYLKILFILFLFQNCTTSKIKIEGGFICDGELECCQENKKTMDYLNSLKYSNLVTEYKKNGKTIYKGYMMGNDEEYSMSFFCIRNEANEIIYYQENIVKCVFYKNNKEGEKMRKIILAVTSSPTYH